MRILIAEDSRSIRLSLAKLLHKWGHEVVQAANGVEALEAFAAAPVSLIISDWMMPEMDGIELCKRVRASDSERYTYFILLTARSEKSDLVEGMEAGADDFISKPFNRSELQVRIRAAERMLDLQGELADRNERLSVAYETIRKDLESAAKIQYELLPSEDSQLAGIDFRWLFLPSTFVAGDIFDYCRLDEHHVAFYHLDVAGHGISSALLSVSVSRVLRPDPRQPSMGMSNGEPVAPAELVSMLNSQFLGRGDTVLYFTMLYGLLDLRDGHVRLCQAGHPCPLLVEANGQSRFVGDGGFPVAMLPDMEYDEMSLYLSPGDRLVLYSDGITECENHSGEMFGDDRLAELFADDQRGGAKQGLIKLSETLRAWNGSDAFADDVSVLALEMPGPATGEPNSEDC
jgi:sigma-B regulation protein RsbU (phosphoserine phosphatase)